MLDQIEKNLLILLDPLGTEKEAEWQFVPWREKKRFLMTSGVDRKRSIRTVYCFERRDLISYFLFRWYTIIKGLKKGCRAILYLNDGLLSSLFDARSASAYRIFAADHLPRLKKLHRRLILLLPLWLRAEKRYISIGEKIVIGSDSNCTWKGDLKRIDFMFFSNMSGKLLLTNSKTFKSGTGIVFKATSNSDYVSVMEKEFATMSFIAGLQKNVPVIPSIGKRFQTSNNTFFTEEYVRGRTLREIIQGFSSKKDIEGTCAIIDHLDRWFMAYSALFQGVRRPLVSFYGHLFNAFDALYGTEQKAHDISAMAYKVLAEIAHEHSGVIAIFAHNDLWPGNFMVNGEQFFAIDWERATSDRAPFFDYYWMIISTVLEYHVFTIGVIDDFSSAFRIFFKEDDSVSFHAKEKLLSFLVRHKINEKMHSHFLLLFLMEWSVQGYLALGRQTDMDKLAYGELLNFCEKGYCDIRSMGR
jgi:hypothetical protein